MTGAGSQNIVSVRPQSNLYTFLVILAILVLASGVGDSLHSLLSPAGYGATPAEQRKPGQADYGLRFEDVLKLKSVNDLVLENRLPPEASPPKSGGK